MLRYAMSEAGEAYARAVCRVLRDRERCAHIARRRSLSSSFRASDAFETERPTQVMTGTLLRYAAPHAPRGRRVLVSTSPHMAGTRSCATCCSTSTRAAPAIAQHSIA